jgi:hypothetical protein
MYSIPAALRQSAHRSLSQPGHRSPIPGLRDPVRIFGLSGTAADCSQYGPDIKASEIPLVQLEGRQLQAVPAKCRERSYSLQQEAA